MAARLVESGKLRIQVAHSYSLSQAPAAQDTSQRGHIAGRTVIVLD